MAGLNLRTSDAIFSMIKDTTQRQGQPTGKVGHMTWLELNRAVVVYV